ncbi:uncharacterized protein E5676_scaffold13G003940 [Cucumis melo var. makuwa]|uniref:Uncharacterized protein n=1 Tax=Cucumis melo var. makuwa TaxID=1194695 RepID=A0A5D3C9U7_CUCMM|nr:uncharacterized protein E6C27_scaffold139G003920 [Cucumis melo var. makuwa]TYK07076.1 uncharacterized protein E5676_scaffold13G003940 [Cucumis melo var. makuwa]
MSFFSKFSSCWRSAAVAPRVYLGDAVSEEVKAEQSVVRPRSSKSDSAAHWRPALDAIVEDGRGAQSRWKKSREKKPEKKTSGRQGRFMTKSYGYYDGRDDYW